MQYIALIHTNTNSTPTDQDWQEFIELAMESGMFEGGSEVGSRKLLGSKPVADTTESVGGFMRFDTNNVDTLLQLLEQHPVLQHGGSIELCEMPKS